MKKTVLILTILVSSFSISAQEYKHNGTYTDQEDGGKCIVCIKNDSIGISIDETGGCFRYKYSYYGTFSLENEIINLEENLIFQKTTSITSFPRKDKKSSIVITGYDFDLYGYLRLNLLDTKGKREMTAPFIGREEYILSDKDLASLSDPNVKLVIGGWGFYTERSLKAEPGMKYVIQIQAMDIATLTPKVQMRFTDNKNGITIDTFEHLYQLTKKNECKYVLPSILHR